MAKGKNPFAKEGKKPAPKGKGKSCPHCGGKLDAKGKCADCGKKY